MSELSCAHNDCVTKFSHLRIELLRSCEDLRHEVHWELMLCCFILVFDFLLDDQGSTDCGVRGRDVQDERLPLFWTRQFWQMLEVAFQIIKGFLLLCSPVYFWGAP
jgi:hypothetical protein